MSLSLKNSKRTSSGRWVRLSKDRLSFWILKKSIRWKRFRTKSPATRLNRKNYPGFFSRLRRSRKNMVLRLRMLTPNTIRHFKNSKSKILRSKTCRGITRKFKINANISRIFTKRWGQTEICTPKTSSNLRTKSTSLRKSIKGWPMLWNSFVRK